MREPDVVRRGTPGTTETRLIAILIGLSLVALNLEFSRITSSDGPSIIELERSAGDTSLSIPGPVEDHHPCRALPAVLPGGPSALSFNGTNSYVQGADSAPACVSH